MVYKTIRGVGSQSIEGVVKAIGNLDYLYYSVYDEDIMHNPKSKFETLLDLNFSESGGIVIRIEFLDSAVD